MQGNKTVKPVEVSIESTPTATEEPALNTNDDLTKIPEHDI